MKPDPDPDPALQPWSHDFFALLRRIQAERADLPPLGTALRPAGEPLRLGQDVELDFAPAALSSWRMSEITGVPRLGVRFFGLFGPMGPMPLHLTEFVREREHQAGDSAPARFADIFHHRALLLFFRAWAQAQPTVQRDRPGQDVFARQAGALGGLAPPGTPSGDSLPDDLRRHLLGHLLHGPRHAEGLRKMIAAHFGLPVRIESHAGHWMTLHPQDRTRLRPLAGAGSRNRLGVDVVAGSRVWNRQYRFRVHLGPLGWADYERFLPGTPALRALHDLVACFVGPSLRWEIRPALRGAEVPPLRLTGRSGRLGLSTWLGRRGPHPDRADLRLSSDRRLSPGDPVHV